MFHYAQWGIKLCAMLSSVHWWESSQTLSLEAEWFTLRQNLRGHLTAITAANGDSMSRLCIWAKRATVMFSMDGLIPLLMPLTLKPSGWGWAGSHELSEFSCIIPVRWFILANSLLWTPPHQTWGSRSVWCWQGIRWAPWACLWSLCWKGAMQCSVHSPSFSTVIFVCWTTPAFQGWSLLVRGE
jgi:hypothetical protein